MKSGGMAQGNARSSDSLRNRISGAYIIMRGYRDQRSWQSLRHEPELFFLSF